MATKESPGICLTVTGSDHRRPTGALRGVLKVLQKVGRHFSHWGAIENPCKVSQNHDPKGGTRWHLIDSTKFGTLFATKDQVVTVEASNLYAAQFVLLNQCLNGFYLPVKRNSRRVSDRSKSTPNQ